MDKQAKMHFEAAATAQRQGQRMVARRHWQALLETVPEHPVALNALGADALMENDLSRAVDLFRKAAIADAASPELWLNLARAQNLSGDVPGEGESLKRGFALAPSDLAINIRLAQFHERRGDRSGAVERWTVVLGIAQNNPSVSEEGQRLVEHGRRYLATLTDQLTAHVDGALDSIRRSTPIAERRRAEAAIDRALGRRTIYVNHCSGLHVPFLPADEFFDSAKFPWFGALQHAAPVIRDELLSVLGPANLLPNTFIPYVELPVGVSAEHWNRLNGSTNWSAMHFWRDGERVEETCARFPRTASLLDTFPLASLPKRMPTIFFSALAAHTHIPPHTGVTNARAIVHLPLIVPEGCRFRVGGETRHWQQDTPFAFDDTIEHEAWNDSDSLRVVLIMDSWNPYLTMPEQLLIKAFYAAAEASELAPTLSERARLG